MKKETYHCDICAEEVPKPDEKSRAFQVIFTTEQTEGRRVRPHLSYEIIDICNECMDRILKGEAVYGAGAQGHNNYFFEK